MEGQQRKIFGSRSLEILCIITGNQIVTQLTWPQSVNSHSITSVFFFPGLACAVKCCMALIQRFMPYVFQLNFKQGSAGHITTTIMELCKFMSYFKKSISHKKCLGHLCDSTIKYIHLFLEKHYSWPHQED